MHRTTSVSLLHVLAAIVITIMLSDVEEAEAQAASNRVIVIGAGFSGLAAAKHLRDNGREVLVLEARDRIGGRVVTDRSADGVPLDMGASWIHGVTKNPIFALAKTLGVPLSAKTNYDSMEMFDVDGTRNTVSPADLDRFVDAVEAVSRVKVQQKSGDSLEKAVMDLWKAGKLSYFSNLRELNFAVASEFDLEYAGDASLMSAQQPWEGEELGGGDVIFPAGYDQLPAALAEGLDVSLETVVTNIAYSSSGVAVTTNKGVLRGSRVIVTVPVGVLRSGSVTFFPALPLAKRQALGRIGMGTLNKVWMIFPNAFWDTRKTVLAYASEPKGHFSEFYYFKEVAGGKALLALNGGLVAESLESKPDQEIIDEMLATLRIMYGADRVPAPTHTRISRWSKDPYSYGSYSFLQAGASSADRATLRSAVAKRVFFAGEALHSANPATVHGAYLSGIQAAKDVLKV